MRQPNRDRDADLAFYVALAAAVIALGYLLLTALPAFV